MTGNLLLITGAAHPDKKIVFTPDDAPRNTDAGTVLWTSTQVTSVGGVFSATLGQGSYRVSIDGILWRRICVPAGNGVYSFHSGGLDCGTGTALWLVNTNDFFKVKADGSDLTANYLYAELEAGTNIVLEVLDDGTGTNSVVRINASAGDSRTFNPGQFSEVGEEITITDVTGVTGVTAINPTDGRVPSRADADTFVDSPWYHISDTTMGFGPLTNQFLWVYDAGGNDGQLLGMGRGALSGTGNDPALNGRVTAIGWGAMRDSLFNGTSVALGWEAGAWATNYTASVAIGASAGTVEDATGLVSIGASAGPGYYRSFGDTVIGGAAGVSLDGSTNTVVGYFAAYAAAENTTSLTSLGAYSGHVGEGVLGDQNRSYSTFLGTWAGWNAVADVDITNAIAIGFNVPVTNSNEIIIGNSANTKLIVPIPSFSGTGTKFYSDDGTFKTAGGGDTLWTDFGTFIAPAGFTNRVALSTHGQLRLGIGGPDVSNLEWPGLYSFSTPAQNLGEIFVGIQDPADTNTIVTGFNSFGDLTISGEWDTWNYSTNASWQVHNGPADAFLEAKVGGNSYLKLWPSVPDGETAVANSFDTVTPLTEPGAQLAEFKNAGTNRMSITASGSITTGGDTNRWSFAEIQTPGGVTNLVIIVNGQRFKVLADPIP